MATHPLTDFLARLVRRENLNRDEAFELLDASLRMLALEAVVASYGLLTVGGAQSDPNSP